MVVPDKVWQKLWGGDCGVKDPYEKIFTNKPRSLIKKWRKRHNIDTKKKYTKYPNKVPALRAHEF